VTGQTHHLHRNWPEVFNPLTWLGRRAADARPAFVDIDVTVLGRGLEHCTGVRITVNDTSAACPCRIVRQPQVRSPQSWSSSKRSSLTIDSKVVGVWILAGHL